MTTTITTHVDNYRAADQELRARRRTWRLEETKLIASRDAALRDLVGTHRGGVATAARSLEISDTQVFRMLDEGITRAARGALDDADIERGDYQLTHQRGGKTISVALTTGTRTSQEMITAALERAGLVVLGQQPVSTTTTDALRWAALKDTKLRAQRALVAAGISAKTYRLAERRGAATVQLTFTALVAGFVPDIAQRICGVLTRAGLVATAGPESSLMISDGVGTEIRQETLFGWTRYSYRSRSKPRLIWSGLTVSRPTW